MFSENKKGTSLWNAIFYEHRLPWRYQRYLDMLPFADKFKERMTSHPVLDKYVEEQVQKIKPRIVVDFGPGLGKQGKILRKFFRKDINQFLVPYGFTGATTQKSKMAAVSALSSSSSSS